jgi:hypothetical protein
MTEVRQPLSIPAARAYELFCDGARLHWWVPGLRQATVLAVDPGGLPAEIRFEFAVRRSYVLRYCYEPGALRVSWRPTEGEEQAVSGEATFVDEGEGATLIYREEAVGEARSAAERRAFSAAEVARSFAAYAAGS